MLKQNTLNGSFSLCGKGLHTGLSLTVTFNPAAENHGYKIQRISGHSAMLKMEDNSQELQILIANNILIQLNGSGVSETELLAYAEALDIDAISHR